MRKLGLSLFTAVAVGAMALCAAPTADAAPISAKMPTMDISIGFGYSTGYGYAPPAYAPPAYYAPAPVYAAPVYAAPVYYPRYYRPRYYRPYYPRYYAPSVSFGIGYYGGSRGYYRGSRGYYRGRGWRSRSRAGGRVIGRRR